MRPTGTAADSVGPHRPAERRHRDGGADTGRGAGRGNGPTPADATGGVASCTMDTARRTPPAICAAVAAADIRGAAPKPR